MLENDKYIPLQNVTLNNVELGLQHSRQFSFRNTGPLPLKLRWDSYNKDNVFSNSNVLKITPSELVIEAETEQNFTLNYNPTKIGYENYVAILNCENVHRLAMKNSPVLREMDTEKTK